MEHIIKWKCEDAIENGTKHQFCETSQTEPLLTPFFSSGDIMISVMLLLLFLVELIKLLKTSTKAEVIRNYQGNNSPDGKEFYKI